MNQDRGFIVQDKKVQGKKTAVKALIQLQILSGLAGLLVLTVWVSPIYGLAFLYGVALMAGNGYWLAGRLAKVRDMDARAGQTSLYAGAAIRFVALIAGLILAQILGLHLLIVAAGMFAGQIALFMSALLKYRTDLKKTELRKKGEDVG